MRDQFADRLENGYDDEYIYDEESEDLVQNNSRRPRITNDNRTNYTTNTTVWKILAFVSFAILILFATDVIEFKRTNTGSVKQKQLASTDKADLENSNHLENELEEAKRKYQQDAAARSKQKIAAEMKAKEEAAASSAAKEREDEKATVKKKAEEDAAAAKKREDEKAAVKKKAEEDAAAAAAAKKREDEKAAVKKKAEEDAAAAVDKKKAEDSATATKTETLTKSDVVTSRHQYRRRGRPINNEIRAAMIEKWGNWKLEDSKERPTTDFYATYPNRDVPRKEFPDNAWQIDKTWLSKFLPESIALVDRAINAILDEYGQPKDGSSQLFKVEKHEKWIGQMEKQKCSTQGGCTTTASWDNLKRRLLHAVMTEDMFVFAMGGHSSAAGHGNHFQQSYTLQVQWIIEAVFSRLGVRHQSRNFGLGGLGTTQSGLATKSLFGHDVDMLLWDSGMTEKEAKARDMFFRQGILGEGKVPLIMSMTSRNDVIALLNTNADADIFMVGDQSSLPKAETLEDVEKMPWAAQYVRCGSEISGICRENEYAGQCW